MRETRSFIQAMTERSNQMTKEELLKTIKENLNLFTDPEQEVIEDVLEFNNKSDGDKKPEADEKDKNEKPLEENKEMPNEAKAEGDPKEEPKEDKPEDKKEESSEQPEAKPEEQPAAAPQEEQPPAPEMPPQPMGDPRVDELIKQFGAVMGKMANIEDIVSKIVVVKPLEETQKPGFGETAKGNPTEVNNSSATDQLVRSMGGYGR